MDAQQVFKSKFKALINKDYSIATDTEMYQGVLGHALSNVDFSVGMGIYMLPSDLNLNIGKRKGYKSKILVSNTDMKIGSNRSINNDHRKLLLPVPSKAESVVHRRFIIGTGTNEPVKDRLATQD